VGRPGAKIASEDEIEMTHQLNTNREIAMTAVGLSAGTRLVRNPARPVRSALFTGWGPRIGF
jgi:hypothetical protein